MAAEMNLEASQVTCKFTSHLPDQYQVPTTEIVSLSTLYNILDSFSTGCFQNLAQSLWAFCMSYTLIHVCWTMQNLVQCSTELWNLVHCCSFVSVLARPILYGIAFCSFIIITQIYHLMRGLNQWDTVFAKSSTLSMWTFHIHLIYVIVFCNAVKTAPCHINLNSA